MKQIDREDFEAAMYKEVKQMFGNKETTHANMILQEKELLPPPGIMINNIGEDMARHDGDIYHKYWRRWDSSNVCQINV
eukprot:12309711-Ditylum_brightwellii.AAC.1